MWKISVTCLASMWSYGILVKSCFAGELGRYPPVPGWCRNGPFRRTSPILLKLVFSVGTWLWITDRVSKHRSGRYFGCLDVQCVGHVSRSYDSVCPGPRPAKGRRTACGSWVWSLPVSPSFPPLGRAVRGLEEVPGQFRCPEKVKFGRVGRPAASAGPRSSGRNPLRGGFRRRGAGSPPGL